MNPCRIIIADDHKLLRQGIKSIIEGMDDIKVVGEADDGLELLDLVKRISPLPDIIILDLSMPNLRGFEAAYEIKSTNPEISILVLSMHREKEYIYRAFSAGASGYLLKEDTDTELFHAIDTIRKGGVYLSPLLQNEITADLAEIGKGSFKPFEENLTTREKEVLKLIAEGKSNRVIAQMLFISVRTVEHHRASIMKKLDLKTTADVVKYAIRKGYTTPQT